MRSADEGYDTFRFRTMKTKALSLAVAHGIAPCEAPDAGRGPRLSAANAARLDRLSEWYLPGRFGVVRDLADGEGLGENFELHASFVQR